MSLVFCFCKKAHISSVSTQAAQHLCCVCVCMRACVCVRARERSCVCVRVVLFFAALIEVSPKFLNPNLKDYSFFL